ncbi:hypothetical protein NQ317_013256, partial [Molorchus minor]
ILQNLQKKRTERRGRLSSEVNKFKSTKSNLIFKVTRFEPALRMPDPRRLCFRLRHWMDLELTQYRRPFEKYCNFVQIGIHVNLFGLVSISIS